MAEKQTKPKAEKQTKPKAKAKPKLDGVEFVYVGDLKETHCFGVDFKKGEASLVKSELGIKKLSNHPHFESK